MASITYNCNIIAIIYYIFLDMKVMFSPLRLDVLFRIMLVSMTIMVSVNTNHANL